MKKFTNGVAFLFLFLAISCTITPKRVITLEGRGVYRADIRVIDQETRKIMPPTRVYYARLTSFTDFRSESVILSEQFDEHGQSFINPGPGIYAVVALERIVNNRIAVTFLNEELILKTAMEIKPGMVSTIRFRVMDYQISIFDKAEQSAHYYKKRLNKRQTEFIYFTIGKFQELPEVLAEKRKELKLKEEREKVEEAKTVIEKY